eukprot:6186899-Ditylum_brightwellii.AAC.1
MLKQEKLTTPDDPKKKKRTWAMKVRCTETQYCVQTSEEVHLLMKLDAESNGKHSSDDLVGSQSSK